MVLMAPVFQEVPPMYELSANMDVWMMLGRFVQPHEEGKAADPETEEPLEGEPEAEVQLERPLPKDGGTLAQRDPRPDSRRAPDGRGPRVLLCGSEAAAHERGGPHDDRVP